MVKRYLFLTIIRSLFCEGFFYFVCLFFYFLFCFALFLVKISLLHYLF